MRCQAHDGQLHKKPHTGAEQDTAKLVAQLLATSPHAV